MDKRLPTMTKNALARAGHVGDDVFGLSLRYLLSIPGIGPKSVEYLAELEMDNRKRRK